MTRNPAAGFVLAILVGVGAHAQSPASTGRYLGQAPPGMEARLFAPGVVNLGLYTRDLAVSPDGRYPFFMSGRMPAIADMPSPLTLAYLRRLQATAPNGDPAVYWIDAQVVTRLKPAPPATFPQVR